MIPVGNDNPARGAPVATLFFMAVCVVVFGYELIVPKGETGALIGRWGLIPAHFWEFDIRNPGGWLRESGVTLFSSMFLHGSIIHLLGNIWSLWIFGRELESRLGFMRYAQLYVLTGLLAGVLHAGLNAQSELPTIGASGAIAGVMGAYFLLFPFNWITFLVPVFFIPLLIKMPAAFYLLVWIATQLAGGYQTLANGSPVAGGIAFWAHVGGFFSGMLLIRRWGIKRRRKAGRRK
jgi:membrane associated rhomboid family serine protease